MFRRNCAESYAKKSQVFAEDHSLRFVDLARSGIWGAFDQDKPQFPENWDQREWFRGGWKYEVKQRSVYIIRC